MGTPSQTSGGSTCIQVSRQNILQIAGTESNGINSATEFFLIKWNGVVDASDCRGCTDGTNTVPVRGDLHPVDTSLHAARTEIHPVENESRLIFQQRTEYTDDIDGAASPLTIAPDINWDFSTPQQLPYFLDNDPAGSKPVVNKAGQRFSEFLQRYQGEVSATFEVNIPLSGAGSWVASTVLDYCAGGTNQSSPAVNNDTFTFDGLTIAIGQARAVGVTCSGIQIQNGVKFRKKKWTLAFRKNWNDIVENRGFEQLVTLSIPVLGSVSALVPIDSHLPPGTQPSAPWPLNNSGGAMANCTDVPPLLTFYPYPQLAFSTLGFI